MSVNGSTRAVLGAEVSVVGGMIVGPDMIPAVLELVHEGDFMADRHRRIFRAVVALHDARSAVDELTVVGRLREAGDLDAVGGVVAVSELTSQVPSAANIEYHARMVAREGARRRIRETAERIRVLADDPAANPEQLQADAEALLREAVPRSAGVGPMRVREYLGDTFAHLEKLTTREQEIPGVKCGLDAVDHKLGPIEPGDLVILAGRPSMGKSSFGVCNLAADVAIRQRKPTVLFSIETNPRGVTKRLLGSEGRINMAALRRRREFYEDEYGRLSAATSLLNSSPLWIDHTPGLTVDQMRLKLRRAVHEQGRVDLVVVDYLQLMTDPRARSRYEEVSLVSSGLKRVANEFDTAVVALSQLSRAVEQRPDKRPMMSDLRESGTLEQDADVIMLLYRPEYYHGPTMKVGRGKDIREVNVEGKAEVILAKVRDGETGAAVVGFDREFTHFYDLGGR